MSAGAQTVLNKAMIFVSSRIGREVKEEEFITGDDYELEWVCEHNVGHPVFPTKDSVHTCCIEQCCKMLR